MTIIRILTAALFFIAFTACTFSGPSERLRSRYSTQFSQLGIDIVHSQRVRSNDVRREDGALHKSSGLSGGKQMNWQQAFGPFGADARSIVHTKTGSVFLCSFGGLYRAASAGAVWKKVISTYDLGSMFVHPSGAVFAFSSMGTYRSVDDGKSWTVLFGDSDVRDVVTDSAGNMYAASYRSGLLFSSDTGRTWKKIGLADKFLVSIAFTRSGKLLCGSMDNLYISLNTGATWDSVNVEGMTIYSIKQSNNGTIFALGEEKLFRSKNDGKTWDGSASNDWLYRFYIDDNNTLYALGLFYGVSQSTDGGDSWTASSLPKRNLLCMHFIGRDTIAVGMDYGVLLSTDHGNSWTRNDSGLVSSYIGSISETRSGDIIVSTAKEIFRTSDNGAHWNLVYSGNWSPTIMASDPAGAMYAIDMSGVIKSTDGGESWTRLTLSVAPYFISTMAVKGVNTVFAGSSIGDIYKSSDGGKTWKLLFADPRRDFISGLTIAENGNVYCGTSSSILRSADDGVSWQDINTGTIPFQATAIMYRSKTLFIGTLNNGILTSTDEGVRWKSPSNVLSKEYIRSMTSDRNGTLYATTLRAMYTSTDLGETWNSISDGLHLYVLNRVFVSSKGYIYLGSQQDGLYRSVSPVFQINPSLIETSYRLYPNYPNPFNPSTTIVFNLPTTSLVTLTIYDMLGQEVATLVNEELAAGQYSRMWNASAMPSGVYFYRLQAGTYTESKRLLLLR